jgi:site-specific recombinase
MIAELTTQYAYKWQVASQQKRVAEDYRRSIQNMLARSLVEQNPAQ